MLISFSRRGETANTSQLDCKIIERSLRYAEYIGPRCGLIPSTWQGLHAAFPAPEPPLGDYGRTSWPHAAACAAAPLTLAVGLWRPQWRRIAANSTTAVFHVASVAEFYTNGRKKAYARDYLAEKGIAVPKRPWLNPTRQFLADDARWAGGVLGLAACGLGARRAGAVKMSMLERLAVGWVCGSSVGLVGFTYTWPLLFRARYAEWKTVTEGKEKEAQKWTQDVCTSVARYRYRQLVKKGKVPIDLRSPLLGNDMETFLPDYVLDNALQLFEKPAPAREINQDVGLHYTAKEYGELDPVPVPCVDYTWLVSTPREKVGEVLEPHMAELRTSREKLLRDKEYTAEWLACSELEYYQAFEQATAGRLDALTCDRKVLELQRYCQGLSSTHHALHTTIGNIEWMLAGCENVMRRAQTGRPLMLPYRCAAWAACDSDIVPERTLALLLERKKKLEYLEEHCKRLVPALQLSLSEFPETGETPREAREKMRKESKVQKARDALRVISEHREAADRLCVWLSCSLEPCDPRSVCW